MSIFLLTSAVLFFFFLLFTLFQGSMKDSLKNYGHGVLASLPALLGLWLFRNLLVPVYGSVLGVFFYWLNDYFWYLAAAFGFFWFFKSDAPEYAERRRRQVCFSLGVLAFSGFATLISLDHVRESYYLILLPILRVAVTLIGVYLMDRAKDEFGSARVRFIAATVGITLVAALVPVFHFWKIYWASVPLFLAVVALACYIFQDKFASFPSAILPEKYGKKE
jgi:hypothetical protein